MMMPIKEKVLHVDRIVAVSEQLIGFIIKQILNPRREFYEDSHVNKESASTS
jgi:hypothetical protein